MANCRKPFWTMISQQEEIEEYGKTVAFHGQIIAGTHPRVKIPDHLVSRSRSCLKASHGFGH